MNRVIKLRGRAIETNRWVYGTGYHVTEFTDEYAKEFGRKHEAFIFAEQGWVEVHLESISQFTGLHDKSGIEIYEKDITQLDVDGQVRCFVVSKRTVIREVVSHPNFIDETAKVAITGIVFEWNGFELFPCVDENGKSDVEDMVVVGNIYEHPHLLKGV
ncbi:YopX family protein [Sporosarcina contaminans]|uniref:YopX family protein n=1 Tax=Sporosarcina contaminans TaxID=633403 RepID=A0ABW3U166_9BACL